MERRSPGVVVLVPVAGVRVLAVRRVVAGVRGACEGDARLFAVLRKSRYWAFS